MANLFLVFLCFQIVLAFNTNGTCKTEVMPLAVRASLFLTVVSHLTLTPLLVKCLPLVNSVPYVIQYNAKCAACTESEYPISRSTIQKCYDFGHDICTEIYLSLVQKRFTENWVLPAMGALHQTEPIRWNALYIALGRAFFSSHFDNFYTSKLIWGWVVRMHSSTPWSRLWREPAKMLKSIWTHMIDVINHAFRKPISVDRFYPRKL